MLSRMVFNIKCCLRGSRGGGAGDLKNHKAIGFLSNTRLGPP